MSGIVGIVSRAPLADHPSLLHRLTQAMSYRGPDDQRTWCDAGIGLGHALLHTDDGPRGSSQPFSRDGQVWITADARLDDRSELGARLPQEESPNEESLILASYGQWDLATPQYLLGDYAFAIWDRPKRRLFCARDPLGIKPFYYVCRPDFLLFSNTLPALFEHPDVSRELDDTAAIDHVLFGYLQDDAATMFSHIRRLPPGHMLTWSEGCLSVRRYWFPPAGQEIVYRRPEEYVEHFKTLVDKAVRDRLRTRSVGLYMSGGLDSTFVAATTRAALAETSAPFDLRAYCVVADEAGKDEERFYASQTAAALGIRIEYLVAERYAPYEERSESSRITPHPNHGPDAAIAVDQWARIAEHHRVALSGHGGDPLLIPCAGYFLRLLSNLQVGRLAWEMAKYVGRHWTIPRWGLRSALRRKGVICHRPADPMPGWLRPQFRALARARQEASVIASPVVPIDSLHTEAWYSILSPGFANLFERCDPGATYFPVEERHPLFDMRVVEFVTAIPPLPWCIDKRLLRDAANRLIPEPVRTRRKTLARWDPVGAKTDLLRRAAVRAVQAQACREVGCIDPVELAGSIDALDRLGGEDYYRTINAVNLLKWKQVVETGSSLHSPKETRDEEARN